MSILVGLMAAAGMMMPDTVQDVILASPEAAMLSPMYTRIAAEGGIRETVAESFDWFVDALPSRRNQINNGGSAYTSGTTTLVVDSSAPFYRNCLIFCEATGEVMLCMSVTDATTIVVARGWGAATGGVAAHADSVANDAWLRCIGSASGENASLMDPRTGLPTQLINTVQTYRKTIDYSGRSERTKTRTEEEMARQQAKRLREMLDDFDQSIRLGARNSGTNDAAGKRVTSSVGLRQVITKVDNVAGTMTLTRFHQYCESAFELKYGTKVMFCGGTMIRTIHDLYLNKYRVINNAQAPGLTITEVLTPFGPLELVYHQGMVGPEATEGVTVDLGNIALRRTNGGELDFRRDVVKAGVDGKTDEWFAEHGLEYGTPAAHSRLTGVTGAA